MHLDRPRKGLTFREVKKASPSTLSKLMEEGLDLSRSYRSKGGISKQVPRGKFTQLASTLR